MDGSIPDDRMRHGSTADDSTNLRRFTGGGEADRAGSAIDQPRHLERTRETPRPGNRILGNHTFSHRDLNELTPDGFETELIRGETSIAKVLSEHGKKPRYLRFPMNHSGDTKEKHDAVSAVLARHGYRLATCTIDNEDYNFEQSYETILARKDEVSARKLRAEYLAYTAVEIDYYSNLHNKSSVGRFRTSCCCTPTG
jgi:peptidoglycan/xylan/chitin deacetylase (PgdA/CDA1 family)